MRAALFSYPMIFQRTGGLQVQIRETLAALKDRGVEVSLFDWRNDDLSSFDVFHVFAAINGNHRAVEAARAAGVPVIISSVLHPPFSAGDRVRARIASGLTGRLTRWQSRTTFDEISASLQNANRVVALSEQEREMLISGYRVAAEKVATIPNGISPRFFNADRDRFVKKYDVSLPFVLCCAAVNPYKNQLAVARAAAACGVEAILIGRCSAEHRPYLEECLAAGQGFVRYIGEMSYHDDALPSAFAAASVFLLTSRSEVAPLAVLEALASGTPTIITRHHSLGIERQSNLLEVDPNRQDEITEALKKMLYRSKNVGACQDMVRHLQWSHVGAALRKEYEFVTADSSL